MARWVGTSSFVYSHGWAILHATAALRIGVVGYEDTTALDMVGPAKALASAMRETAKGTSERCYEVVVLGLTKRPFRTASGIVFRPTATIEAAPALDPLVIPGGCGPRARHKRTDSGVGLAQSGRDAARRLFLHRHLRPRGERTARRPAGVRPRTGGLRRTWRDAFRHSGWDPTPLR